MSRGSVAYFLFALCLCVILFDLKMNAQKQKGQNVDAATAQKAVDILKVCQIQCHKK